MIEQWDNQTIMHPLGLAATIALGLMMLMTPRQYALISLFILACFIATAQRLVIFTLDFNLLRILVVVGLCRVFLWGEHRQYRWTTIDTVLLLWAVSGTIVYTIQQGSIAALINRFGVLFDAVGFYFLFRCLIRSWTDFETVVCALAVLSIPVAGMFLIEHSSGHNPFAIFGGVPEVTMIRQGQLRCQGAFPHPIMAGCFWAALLPLFMALMFRGPAKFVLALFAMASTVVIVTTTASSTPIVAMIFACLGWAAFLVRKQIRWIAGIGIIGIFGLQLMMTKPVWHLLARMNVTGGSTGWHRYNLINQSVKHFGEWFLLGTKSTAHWGYGLGDVTNQYILEGLRGGLITLLLFVLLVACAFSAIGRRARAVQDDVQERLMMWSLGVSLFVHATSFMAVSYFGQNMMLWYFSLAVAAGSIAYPIKRCPYVSERNVPDMPSDSFIVGLPA